MGKIIDFETGKPTDVTIEFTPEFEVNPNESFPWVRAIQYADGSCVIRSQTAQDHFIDVEITSWNALDLIETLAGFLRSMK